MRERFRIPSRPDVLPDRRFLTKGLKLIPTDLALAEHRSTGRKEFRQTFQAR